MSITRRLLPIALTSAFLFLPAPSEAQNTSSWNGIWAGGVGKTGSAAIRISIAHDKVVGYALNGAPFAVQYSRVTPNTVSFGDRDHYFVKLKRTGKATAAGQIHDRAGAGALTLTKAVRASSVLTPAGQALTNP